jgi:hypothetical protein
MSYSLAFTILSQLLSETISAQWDHASNANGNLLTLLLVQARRTPGALEADSSGLQCLPTPLLTEGPLNLLIVQQQAVVTLPKTLFYLRRKMITRFPMVRSMRTWTKL